MARAANSSSVPPVLLLNQAAVTDLFTLQDCIPAMEEAFAAYGRGDVLEPGLLHVPADGGEFHIKVGGLRGASTYFAAKINGGFFGNRAGHGLPSIIGLILLCDGATGRPLALMESGLVTRFRTGATTAVAARYLARANSRTVTVCGAGTQADIQLRALKLVLPIDQAFIWSRSGAETLAATLGPALGIRAQAVTDLVSAARASDVVVTCTPSQKYFLKREHISPGTFIAAVGCDGPDKQEIQPELVSESSVVPDLLRQAVRVGDLHHAVNAGLMRTDQIRGELGSVVAGLAPKRVSDEETIIFDSTGSALQDAAAAAAIFEKAIVLGRGQPFPFWT